MNERPSPFAQRVFIPLLLLGMVDRLFLLFAFGFKYVGDDDGVIWSAAVDYGHGLFHEPYFYGQDYAVMLEALVAAPFARLGVPMHILMPTVTSLLALAPFWSFAFWHRKHRRPVAALVFLAMPLLLPVEYGLMTMITRCFISGIAPLAFVPWILDLHGNRIRSVLLGLVFSAAAFINPNSILFSFPIFIWFLLSNLKRIDRTVWLIVGSLPAAAAYFFAQAYCQSHPERMMHLLHDWRMTFHPTELIPESFGMLNLQFAWLFPMLPTLGCLAFAALPALVVWNFFQHDRARGVALAGAFLLIIISFAFPKTHDGMDSAFYAYSRMFLALPLVLCWALGGWRPSARSGRIVSLLLLLACSVTLLIKCFGTQKVVQSQLEAQDVPVNEASIALLAHDADNIQQVCAAHDVQLIVGSKQLPRLIGASYSCYLYPVLEPALPPTYFQGDERRYWQRRTATSTVFQRILIIGGSVGRPGLPASGEPNWTDVSTPESGPLLLIEGNALLTDSLMAQVLRVDHAL